VKIIILGAGQVGRTAAYHLSREEANDVTVIDTDEEILRDLQDRLDIRTVNGNAASPRILEAAGIAATDILVALTNSDEVNMLACQIAWTLYRTPKKIARVRSADFTERDKLFGENAVAVDVWISPEQLPGAAHLARAHSHGGRPSRRHLSGRQEHQAGGRYRDRGRR
jgi:trk system potassium uptake protein TrkA